MPGSYTSAVLDVVATISPLLTGQTELLASTPPNDTSLPDSAPVTRSDPSRPATPIRAASSGCRWSWQRSGRRIEDERVVRRLTKERHEVAARQQYLAAAVRDQRRALIHHPALKRIGSCSPPPDPAPILRWWPCIGKWCSTGCWSTVNFRCNRLVANVPLPLSQKP